MSNARKRLLVIGYVWPEPDSSAAGRHMLEIIRIFLAREWAVTFATPAAESVHQFDLSALGIDTALIELNSDKFDQWLAPLQPDVVVFDRFMMEEQFGWRVARTCPQAVRILDTEDLHFLRNAREQALRQDQELTDDALKSETAVREVASIFRCDLSLIISQTEMQILTTQFNVDTAVLHYLPFLAKPFETMVPFTQRHNFVFVGTMRHSPNLDAVRYLKKEVWPLIRQQLPEADLHIIGAYMTKEVSQMHKPAEGFWVDGKVEDLSSRLIQTRVCLAPLRFGAGLKGKLIEAMEQGLPSVTTAIGAEGIADQDEWPGYICNEAEDFALSAVRLYQDEQCWTEKQAVGYQLLENNFSATQHAESFWQQLQSIQADLSEHRSRNFFGQMLLHHQMRSTEYLSRWIACKNAKGDKA